MDESEIETQRFAVTDAAALRCIGITGGLHDDFDDTGSEADRVIPALAVALERESGAARVANADASVGDRRAEMPIRNSAFGHHRFGRRAGSPGAKEEQGADRSCFAVRAHRAVFGTGTSQAL